MATVYRAGSTNQPILLAKASSRSSASGESNNQLSKPGLPIVRVPELGLGGRDREGAAARVTPEVEKHGGWGKRAKKHMQLGLSKKRCQVAKMCCFIGFGTFDDSFCASPLAQFLK